MPSRSANPKANMNNRAVVNLMTRVVIYLGTKVSLFVELKNSLYNSAFQNAKSTPIS